MMSDSEFEFSASMELSDDIFNEDLEDSLVALDCCANCDYLQCNDCSFSSR